LVEALPLSQSPHPSSSSALLGFCPTLSDHKRDASVSGLQTGQYIVQNRLIRTRASRSERMHHRFIPLDLATGYLIIPQA
jgi:hypothetical protein